MVGCTVQGTLIARSRAMSYCEPCQSLTAAALNRRWRVPRGNFGGVTYTVSASVSIIEGGAQFFVQNPPTNWSVVFSILYLDEEQGRACHIDRSVLVVHDCLWSRL